MPIGLRYLINHVVFSTKMKMNEIRLLFFSTKKHKNKNKNQTGVLSDNAECLNDIRHIPQDNRFHYYLFF